MEPVIRLQSVSKRFGAEVALDDASWEVPPGVVFALLGENGAGKTTAIRIMLGLAEPNSGNVEVLGLNSAKQGLEIRRRVGYVPERPMLYDWMTVAEIGWFTAAFYGDGYLSSYLALTAGFHLPERRKLKSLSKGMRAKVSLALALAHEPELLILDEPTSGLDAMVRREFLESMVDRAAAGQTVFLSSHQIGEVERVADIVAILRKGQLVLIERLDELKAQIRQLTITTGEDATALPELSGEILSRRRRGRQWQLLLRGNAENAVEEQATALRAHESIQAVEVRPAGLEEIFIAYMQRGEGSGNGRSAEEVPE